MKKIKMPLGEAINRLLELDFKRRNGLHALPDQARAERDLIIQALNAQELDLGFDCDSDGVADNVEIFEQTVATSCCRLSSNKKAPLSRSRASSRLKSLAKVKRG